MVAIDDVRLVVVEQEVVESGDVGSGNNAIAVDVARHSGGSIGLNACANLVNSHTVVGLECEQSDFLVAFFIVAFLDGDAVHTQSTIVNLAHAVGRQLPVFCHSLEHVAVAKLTHVDLATIAATMHVGLHIGEEVTVVESELSHAVGSNRCLVKLLRYVFKAVDDCAVNIVEHWIAIETVDIEILAAIHGLIIGAKQYIFALICVIIITIFCMIIPNTYQVYWNTSADALISRLVKERDRFWTDERKAKAKNIGLTEQEVVTLASIVEEETSKSDELTVVAGLYMNRLKRKMPLQADPTVIFALGGERPKRVLKKHLEVDSPYNTYKYPGLPPAPIRFVSTRSIDAVLNYSKHNYLYMCAKEDFSGYHNFTASLSQHNANAARYQRALRNAGIR